MGLIDTPPLQTSFKGLQTCIWHLVYSQIFFYDFSFREPSHCRLSDDLACTSLSIAFI